MQKRSMPLLMRIMRLVLLCVVFLPAPLLAATGTLPEDRSTGIILAYHRIGEDAYPDTNLRAEQFARQLQQLQNGGYNIVALPHLLSAIKNAEPLPDKTVAITFEGAYKSAFMIAMPILIEHQIPFTVFFASDRADENASRHMSWRDLQGLRRYSFVDFGLLPASYGRLYDQDDTAILADINRARVAFRDHLKREPKLFSYPFGEYSLSYKNLIETQGFDAAFGLHSGAVSSASDFYALPRFSMTESYGDLERFEMVTTALPLPVSDVEPQDPYLNYNNINFGFTVPEALSGSLSGLSCFISGQDAPALEVIGTRRIELRPASPINDGRTRLNCTMPGPADDADHPRWRWFSMLFVRDLDETGD